MRQDPSADSNLYMSHAVLTAPLERGHILWFHDAADSSWSMAKFHLHGAWGSARKSCTHMATGPVRKAP